MRKRGKKETRALMSNHLKQVVTSKHSAIQISFGMIFSIILIVAFIAVAFYAINYFLGIKFCADIGMFKDDLQETINSAWTSDSVSETFSLSLPGSINYVCFVDLADKNGNGRYTAYYDELKKDYTPEVNMFFYPIRKARECGLEKFEILHVDVEGITASENPYCISNVQGKVQVKIEKGIYDNLVCVGDKCESSVEGGNGGGSGGGNECIINDDCVPSTCCHPSTCTTRDQRPDCIGTVCTTVCEPGTLDCQQGQCECINNKCKAVFN